MNTEHDVGTKRRRGRGRKAFWILVSAALVIGVVYTTWTPRSDRFGGPRTDTALLDWNDNQLFDAIAATEAQRGALAPVLERARGVIEAADREQRELRAELLAQLQSDEPDQAEVTGLRDRAIELNEATVELAFELTFEIWSELTPEQRAEALRHWNRRG